MKNLQKSPRSLFLPDARRLLVRQHTFVNTKLHIYRLAAQAFGEYPTFAITERVGAPPEEMASVAQRRTADVFELQGFTLRSVMSNSDADPELAPSVCNVSIRVLLCRRID